MEFLHVLTLSHLFIKSIFISGRKEHFLWKVQFLKSENQEVNVELIHVSGRKYYQDPPEIKLKSILGDPKRIVSEW